MISTIACRSAGRPAACIAFPIVLFVSINSGLGAMACALNPPGLAQRTLDCPFFVYPPARATPRVILGILTTSRSHSCLNQGQEPDVPAVMLLQHPLDIVQRKLVEADKPPTVQKPVKTSLRPLTARLAPQGVGQCRNDVPDGNQNSQTSTPGGK